MQAWKRTSPGIRWKLGGLIILSVLGLTIPTARSATAQAPTPTLPPNRVVVIDDFANIRSGPGTEYDLIGRLNRGQFAEIFGKAQIGQYTWLRVEYLGVPDNQGWVNANSGAVQVVGDIQFLPDIPAPPTPTLPPTTTPMDPAQLLTATPDPNSARLPTFTPPAAAAVRPTLLPAIGTLSERKFPPALAIFSLLVIGLMGLAVNWLRQRS